MFRMWPVSHETFLELQAKLDARGNKQWIEHHIYIPSIDGTERESDLHHKIARRVARRVKRRFRCRVEAVRYRRHEDEVPSVKIIVSFIGTPLTH